MCGNEGMEGNILKYKEGYKIHELTYPLRGMLKRIRTISLFRRLNLPGV